MFGYVKTDLPNTYVKDVVLYKAAYCGLCKSIGRTCGEKARLLLNYDLTFLSVFLHNLKGIDLEVNKEHCVIHRIRKRPVAKPDELSDGIATLNVILAYYKLKDDVYDEGKKRIAKRFFTRPYKKAKRLSPILDETVKKRYDELLELEKKGTDSVDIISDPFGNMMQDVVMYFLGELATEEVKRISYGLGKWIYLIDALDDFDKDKKKNGFNVFINAYPEIASKDQLLKEKQSDLITVFGFIISEITELTGKLKYNFNHDLTDNVLTRGIKQQTKTIMENKQCKSTLKF